MQHMPPECIKCMHFWDRYYVGDYPEIEDGFGCDAFREGIPEEIFIDGQKHREPWPGQDNDIVFTPKTQEA